MEIDFVKNGNYMDRGFSETDYRVLLPDMRIVMTTRDLEKAERFAKQCGGTIHSSKELKQYDDCGKRLY